MKRAVVKAEGRGILASWGSGETVDKSITRTRVLGRIERDTIQEGYTELFIEEQLLRQHCVSMSYGYADFKAQLEKQFRVTYCKKNMMQGTNGPVMRVNVMHISRRTAEMDEADLPLVEAQAG